MWQQIIALALIIFFIWRLFRQKNKQEIKHNEFLLWLIFWSLGAIAIVFIRDIDNFVQRLGFSASGINFLLYLAAIILFYLVFRLRLKISKLEEQITKIVREISLRK